jgi:hypothetical protein
MHWLGTLLEFLGSIPTRKDLRSPGCLIALAVLGLVALLTLMQLGIETLSDALFLN